jgi:AraC-like DNA-binding protein
VLVLAALHRLSLGRLRAAVGRRFTFRGAASWEETVDRIRTEPVEMLVVDPGLEGRPRCQEIERIGVLFPSLPRILYTELTAPVAAVLLRLGQAGIRDVLVAGHDDHPQRVTEILLGAAAQAVSRRLMDEIQDVLETWPGELRWAIETMLREPADMHTVQDLAARARMDRRTCTRWFTKASLPPPRLMLMVIRVVYAHRLLQDPGYTVEDVAAKLGYQRVRSFALNVKEVFGMTPGDLRVSLTPEEAIALVRERYLPAPERRLRIVS